MLLSAPYFNPSLAAVDVLCVRHSKKVMFIGTTIMEMCVIIFVINGKSYYYWITTLQESLPHKGDTLLVEGEKLGGEDVCHIILL